MARNSRPLAGHHFHTLTDAALRYVMQDASEAARAMRSHNLFAESKYLDQVNDAATVLAYRQRKARDAGAARAARRAARMDARPICGENA